MKRRIQRVRIARPSFPMVIGADRKAERSGRKIEQLTVNFRVPERQLKAAAIMQVDINPVSGRVRVSSKEALERIKRRGRVRIQERVSQPRLADLAYGYVLRIVPGVTETQFPVPILEIIAKFSHLTFEPDVEEHILERELFMSRSGV